MIFWLLACLIIAGAVATMVHALMRVRTGEVGNAVSDVQVYRDQLNEVARDEARGVLAETEAEAARLEISRRLLDADRRAQARDEHAPGNRGLAAGIIIATLFAGGVGIYLAQGAPGKPDLPMKSRLAALEAAAQNRPSQMEAETVAAPGLPGPEAVAEDFLELMDRLRAAVKERPSDIQGLTLLARNEARLGNFAAARQTLEQLLAAKEDRVTTGDLAAMIEMMVFSAGGYVSPEAEAYVLRLLAHDPGNRAGRYFLGLLQVQVGRPDLAFPFWRDLLETSVADEPWVPVLRAGIADVAAGAGMKYEPPVARGPTAAEIEAADDMEAEDRDVMIRGMVEGLAARLAQDGGGPEEWAQLVHSLMVLGEEQRARIVYAEAKEVFGDDEAAMAVIRDAGARFGLSE
ncbi:MAG: c-type cytochrome biogenesis protein CcmI [Boseongicola sp.]|nr:c-type cytochrome biogenesis protein CcmI [Boseongicola sp.]